MTDWRNMPGPGDEETWGPCTNHPMDPRTKDDTERYERVEGDIVRRRMADANWFQEALAEADIEQIKEIMAAIGSGGKTAQTIYGIVFKYMRPTESEVHDQMEMEDEPDDRV